MMHLKDVISTVSELKKFYSTFNLKSYIVNSFLNKLQCTSQYQKKFQSNNIDILEINRLIYIRIFAVFYRYTSNIVFITTLFLIDLT